eukprot:TRINITY_DN63096_c0_g1_i1.p1 TRINITY_DN63096_c0_g1~~TRINITY_DN63096_c0_g1_i1.p1  ORF type:complete len:332 (+),score=62.04 TRINITY_DN63096_c0_g1_i1:90-1085(+)
MGHGVVHHSELETVSRIAWNIFSFKGRSIVGPTFQIRFSVAPLKLVLCPVEISGTLTRKQGSAHRLLAQLLLKGQISSCTNLCFRIWRAGEWEPWQPLHSSPVDIDPEKEITVLSKRFFVDLSTRLVQVEFARQEFICSLESWASASEQEGNEKEKQDGDDDDKDDEAEGDEDEDEEDAEEEKYDIAELMDQVETSVDIRRSLAAASLDRQTDSGSCEANKQEAFRSDLSYVSTPAPVGHSLQKEEGSELALNLTNLEHASPDATSLLACAAPRSLRPQQSTHMIHIRHHGLVLDILDLEPDPFDLIAFASYSEKHKRRSKSVDDHKTRST